MPRTAVSLVRLLPARDPGPPDAQLLRAFVAARSEDVFAEIVHRHGPMVLAACRRVLGNVEDAEDAFQAVFLVLARKAGTIRGENLAGWLYAVAARTARGVRIMRDRRRKHELRANPDHQVGGVATPDDIAAVIDEELARLPECYREAVVLCELRGLSRKDAAAELGIPEGTLSSRLATARRKLAARLSARGLATPAALAAVLAPASVSSALVRSAVAATHGLAAPVASAAASAVVKAMLFDQLKTVTLAATLLLTVACGGWAMTGTGGDNPAPGPVEDPVMKLVAQLGAPDFAQREAAQKELRKLGRKAEPALRAALASENPEIRARAVRLLAAIRADALKPLTKFDPAGADEPDHPIWKRFRTIAGNDAAARKLFAELVAEPKRLHILDEADRDPDRAGELYVKEVRAYYASVEWRHPWGANPRPRRPWPDEVVLHYLGTYPNTTRKFTANENLELQLFWSWEEALQSPCVPAVRRVFTAWLAVRDDSEVIRSSLHRVGRDQIAEALPLLRKWMADETVSPAHRTASALLVGQLGTRDDIALLRRVAESPSARKPFEEWQVILKGKAKLDALWGIVRFGGQVKPQEWEQAWKKADVRRGDRTMADGAWAAAVKLAGRKPEELGFLYPRTITGEKVDEDWFFYLDYHGFPDDKSRATAHAKAKTFLDKQAEPKKDDPDPAVLKLVEQLGVPEFADREAAQKSLRKLGMKAEPALRAALKSANPEIRARATRLLTTIRDDALEALAKNFDPDDTDEPDHPIWKRYGSLVGSDRSARHLFAEIIRDPRRLRLLDDAQREPAKAGELYTREVTRLAEETKKRVEGLQRRPARGLPGNVLGSDPKPHPADVAVGFYLGTFPSTAKAFADPNWDRYALPGPTEEQYGLFHTTFQTALDIGRHPAAPERVTAPAFRRLFAAWLAVRENPGSICLGLTQARAAKVAEMLPLARTAANAKNPTLVRAAAIPLLGAFGTAKDEPLVAALLDDKTLYTGTKYGPEQKDAEVQVRDIALASMLVMRGKNPGDFGFPGPEHHAPTELRDLPLFPHDLGFFDDATREAAHKKARAWLEKQKK